MLTPFDKLAAPGIVPDYPDLNLTEGAWTDSRNVRYRDGAVEKVRGYTEALGGLSATAIWAAPISDGTNYYWVYGSNSVLYATDGSSHANVSHPSLSYAATDDLSWSGAAFHGYMIANDGTNIPQTWQPGLANKCTSLTAWPAISCKVLRPFKDFLFALRITDTGTYYPRVLRWSDRAGQSALPLSWDYSDPTNQAGINELGQTGDLLVDAVPLRDSLIIYKEFHTWIANYIGGQDIFDFQQVFSQIGMLTENCAITFGSSQLVLTDNDLVLHNGNDAKSIADRRTRRSLFNRINSNRFKRSFMVADHRNREALICFPESGYDWPTLALVWNWAEDTFDYRELGGPKTYATGGIIPGSAVSFDTDSGTFDDATGTFDEETYNPFLTRVLMLDSMAKKAYQNDTGEDFNGVPMSVYAERTGMGIVKDLTMLKRIKRIFPKVTGTAGDTLRFYVGARSGIGASTSWSGPYTFTIGSDYKIDLRVSARILDLRVEYSGSNTFRLFGMSIEHESDGTR
jgi:hypothetical protein